ncbi:MAG: DUF4325 domain-containing protein [Lachnospiraceae bacterium]|nr:DUF4325 domain-containing protein [Lachnospiraceae bacterium]
MSFTETKRREIKLYLLRKIDDDEADLISKVSDAFGISSTSVKRYLEAELNDGHIHADNAAGCGYSLAFDSRSFQYDIDSIAEHEDTIVYKDILPILKTNDNAGKIWRYVLSEIFNNALEHSQGTTVRVIVETGHLYTRIVLSDDGIGIFRSVTEAMKQYGFHNPTPEDAVMELYKGRFTSSPERHTGEGIFFTMKLLDKTAIVSDGSVLRSGYEGAPAYIRSHLLTYAMRLAKKGTVVDMRLENDTHRDAGEVFNQYTTPDEGLYKTRIPVLEACMDREPVARSQARRICARLDSFKEVILDFGRIEFMGQGFADEIFRVFHNAHPDVVLTPVNMTPDVNNMYLHAANTKVIIPHYD